MSYIAGALTRARRLDVPRPGALGPVLVREMVAPLAFILAILATNYALAGTPNVKFMDLLVFVAGYTLGFRRGVVVATGAWLIYGTFNPWGVAGPLLLVTMMMSEMVYALVGAGLSKLVFPQRVRLVPGLRSLLFAGAAVACTLTYDALTNVYTGVVWAQMVGGTEYGRWIWIALFNPGALLFSAMHVGSNVVFFALFGPALVKGVEKGKAALRWER
ncbi:MAG: hypothetical protein O2783_06235 [Chloroflexi bacterium]|nr:hypothetical protein [Chloroflexota bacterium]